MSSKAERTRKKIMDLGMTLIFSSKYDEVTISQICRISGISRPTFYLHFSSKEHLMAEYFESLQMIDDKMKDWVRSAPDNWNAIIRMQMLYIGQMCIEEHREAISHYLSYRLISGEKNSMQSFNDAFQIAMLPYVKEAQNDGVILNTADPHLLCRSVFLLHVGNIFNWCAGASDTDLYANFFWSMEALFGVNDNYRGLWKLVENQWLD